MVTSYGHSYGIFGVIAFIPHNMKCTHTIWVLFVTSKFVAYDVFDVLIISKFLCPLKCSPTHISVLVRVSIAVKRHHDHGNFYKGNT